MENSQRDPGWSMAGRYGKEMKNRKLWLQERRNEEDCGSQVFFLGRVMPEAKMRQGGVKGKRC